MSEFSHSPDFPNDLAEQFMHASVADFLPASEDMTRFAEEQAELLRFEASLTLPEGETRLSPTAVAVMNHGKLTITSGLQNGDPLFSKEFSVYRQGDNTFVTSSWYVAVPATKTTPATIVPRSMQLMTGPDNDLPFAQELQQDIVSSAVSQGDIKTLTDSMDMWHNALVELKNRPPVKQGWLGRLGEILKLKI